MTCAKETPSPNLEAFLAAKEVREDAKHAFENVLQECLQTMMQAMTEDLLRESVGVVYEEQGERFESHESSIMATFQSNHERRTHLIQLVEQANSNWTRQYKKIRSSIWKVGEEESEKDDGSKIHSSGVGDVDDLAVSTRFPSPRVSPCKRCYGRLKSLFLVIFPPIAYAWAHGSQRASSQIE